MELKCFVYDGWEPRIRPATAKRDWMENAPDSYPYRCLPLNIANGHGWELLNPCGFEAIWNGEMTSTDVEIHADDGTRKQDMPESIFGQGTFTFHVHGLIRTPPGWDLHVSGSPNLFKDGATPLTGIIETDWSPYSFTMNWRLTRPGHRVRFEENEPIAHFFPIERGTIERFEPTYIPIDDDPELKRMYEEWSRSRDDFLVRMREAPPDRVSDRWQKLYYRGMTPDGTCPAGDHRSKLRTRGFSRVDLVGNAPAAMARPVATNGIAVPGPSEMKAARYAWLLETLERQRELSPAASQIPRCRDLTGEQFLDLFYAPARPVVLTDEIEHWPARQRWTASYLETALGEGGAPDALHADIHPLANYLAQPPQALGGTLRLRREGEYTSLHQEFANMLLVQPAGCERFILAAAAETPKLYDDGNGISAVPDVARDDIDFARFPLLEDVQFFEVTLNAGDILFLPVGWWHQALALETGASIAYTNFRWRNDFAASLRA